jgi:murein DD-endopeptidase MepM/ murein hydrolase activator NlpD
MGALVALAIFASSHARAAPVLRWTPERPGDGQPVLFSVRGVAKGARLEGTFLGQTLRFAWDRAAKALTALAAVPLGTRPRAHVVAVRVARAGRTRTLRRRVRTRWIRYARAEVRIRERARKGRALGEPPTKKEIFGAAPGERPAPSKARVRAAYAAPSHDRAWRLPFQRPLATPVTEAFGVRRLYLKLRGARVVKRWRGRHMGLDLDGDGGEPIAAVAGGKVVVAGYFHGMGKAVFLDHGHDLFTAYYHLWRVGVREGQRVRRGDVLGRVGATGLATGPHLHLVARVNGVTVDPQRLLELLGGPLPARATAPVPGERAK